jgi:hypothetical protein
MKTFCVQLVDTTFRVRGGHRFYQLADGWEIRDGFVMFTRHESSDPIFAVRADSVFSIEVQDHGG